MYKIDRRVASFLWFKSKNIFIILTFCRLTLCRTFDPLSFDPLSFDPVSFDLFSVNRLWMFLQTVCCVDLDFARRIFWYPYRHIFNKLKITCIFGFSATNSHLQWSILILSKNAFSKCCLNTVVFTAWFVFHENV